jgi:hypothetical protein
MGELMDGEGKEKNRDLDNEILEIDVKHDFSHGL